MPAVLSLPVLERGPAAGPRPIHPYRPPEPHAIVERVEEGSIAARIGLVPGDEILSINGERMEDVIDYRFLVAERRIRLAVAPGGRREDAYELELEKPPDRTLGVAFTADVFDGIRICTNNCDFCFVYQNRRKMRKSVYVKDDDYRLSFLHGDFITLTNLTEACWERIFRYRLSPLYVSIHATDPEVRVTMLRNPEGARLFEHLDRLFAHGIRIHGQVVLAPGINDGPVLRDTIERMASLHSPGCLSLAVVPVGLTDHRSRLPALRTVRPEEAAETVALCRAYQQRFRQQLGTRFVFPADEMYLLAGLPLPSPREYEDFAQVENGVGLCARLRHEWRQAKEDMDPPRSPRRLALATGTLAAPLLEEIAAEMNAVPGVRARVAPIRNDFFGSSVTVSGLLTGQDLAAQLQPAGRDEEVLIPATALRDGYFLDDWSLERLQATLGVPVTPVAPRGEALALAAGFRRRRRRVRVAAGR